VLVRNICIDELLHKYYYDLGNWSLIEEICFALMMFGLECFRDDKFSGDATAVSGQRRLSPDARPAAFRW
jgi:hypothetical protein